MNVTVSQKIKDLLAQHQISESELARRINIPRPTVNRLVAGKMQSPKLHVLQAIATYFTCDVASLTSVCNQVCYIPWAMLTAMGPKQALPLDTKHKLPKNAIITHCLSEHNPLGDQDLWLVIEPKQKPRQGQWVLVYDRSSQQNHWCTIHIQGMHIQFVPLNQAYPTLSPQDIHWIGVITTIHTVL